MKTTSIGSVILPKPFFALAPMEDVTDTVFRRLLRSWAKRYGGTGPNLMYSEFTRVDSATSAVEAKERGIPYNGRLQFDEIERPIFAQLWGTRPNEFFRAAEAIERLGFDGIDLNLGCPARKIRKSGACSALISDHNRTREIFAACRAGSSLPVSVKTRIGLDRVVTDEWIGFLLDQNLDAITCHGRIADAMSEGWADWREVRKAVELRDKLDARSPSGNPTVIIGNGDIASIAHGLRLATTTGVDGIMIGRGVFTDPLIFTRIPSAGAPGAPPPSAPPSPTILQQSSAGVPDVVYADASTSVPLGTPSDVVYADASTSVPIRTPPSWEVIQIQDRLTLLREHVTAFTAHWGNRRNYEVLKKFFRNYTTRDLRGDGILKELYATENAAEALRIIDRFAASP